VIFHVKPLDFVVFEPMTIIDFVVIWYHHVGMIRYHLGFVFSNP
jgi:hypothetical protein